MRWKDCIGIDVCSSIDQQFEHAFVMLTSPRIMNLHLSTTSLSIIGVPCEEALVVMTSLGIQTVVHHSCRLWYITPTAK